MLGVILGEHSVPKVSAVSVEFSIQQLLLYSPFCGACLRRRSLSQCQLVDVACDSNVEG